MDFGAAMFFPDYPMAPSAFAQALAARGFGSLWPVGSTRWSQPHLAQRQAMVRGIKCTGVRFSNGRCAVDPIARA
jgi:hypothetical protein